MFDKGYVGVAETSQPRSYGYCLVRFGAFGLCEITVVAVGREHGFRNGLLEDGVVAARAVDC